MRNATYNVRPFQNMDTEATIRAMLKTGKTCDYFDTISCYESELDSIVLRAAEEITTKQLNKDLVREDIVFNGKAFRGEEKIPSLRKDIRDILLNFTNNMLSKRGALDAVKGILSGASRTCSGADAYSMIVRLFDVPGVLIKPRQGPVHPVFIDLEMKGNSHLLCTISMSSLFGLFRRADIEGSDNIPDPFVRLDAVVTEHITFKLRPNAHRVHGQVSPGSSPDSHNRRLSPIIPYSSPNGPMRTLPSFDIGSGDDFGSDSDLGSPRAGPTVPLTPDIDEDDAGTAEVALITAQETARLEEPSVNSPGRPQQADNCSTPQRGPTPEPISSTPPSRSLLPPPPPHILLRSSPTHDYPTAPLFTDSDSDSDSDEGGEGGDKNSESPSSPPAGALGAMDWMSALFRANTGASTMSPEEVQKAEKAKRRKAKEAKQQQNDNEKAEQMEEARREAERLDTLRIDARRRDDERRERDEIDRALGKGWRAVMQCSRRRNLSIRTPDTFVPVLSDEVHADLDDCF
jgi:hypothetical protein